MGCLCESNNNKIKNTNNEIENSANDYTPLKIEQKFNDYIFNDDNIQDFSIQKYNLEDPVFRSVKKEENEILFNFYKSKKNEFKNDINIYLEKHNINFNSTLIRQIISNERGKEIIKQKIKDEIEYIKNDKEIFKIEYLTIMIIGQTGVGKSTLVNSLLKLKDIKRSPEGYGDIITKKTKIYKSKEVPYLRLIDTRGIELDSTFGVDKIGSEVNYFVKQRIEENNINDFVHCIWYCVSSNRFQTVEMELINNFSKNNKIPVIIVLTQAINSETIDKMKKHLRAKSFENVINILAKRIEIVCGNYIESYGLDKLVQLTINVCKKTNEEMKNIIFKNLNEFIRKNLL